MYFNAGISIIGVAIISYFMFDNYYFSIGLSIIGGIIMAVSNKKYGAVKVDQEKIDQAKQSIRHQQQSKYK